MLESLRDDMADNRGLPNWIRYEIKEESFIPSILRYPAPWNDDLYNFNRWPASLWVVWKKRVRKTLHQGENSEISNPKTRSQNMMTPRYCLNLLNGNVFAKELVRKMLQKDPKSRITATDAFKDSLFWTRQQKLEHIEHILTGPKSSALENQVQF